MIAKPSLARRASFEMPSGIGNLLQMHAKDRLSNGLRLRVSLKWTSDYLPLAKTCFRAARRNGLRAILGVQRNQNEPSSKLPTK